jgi:DedD protein
MRSVFDEEDVESAREHNDAELTLGSGTLLAIFFGLVLLCGLCFGMGYAIGHRGPAAAATAPAQPATEQEPLQASGSIPKPSAVAQTPVAPLASVDTSSPIADEPAVQVASPPPSASASRPPGMSDSPEVHPALGVSGTPASASYAPAQTVRPALPQQSFMVQIAAVTNAEDAKVLVNALRQRNYPVTMRRDPADSFIHVRIGPFATKEIADQWKNKLMNDGYNAVIQP